MLDVDESSIDEQVRSCVSDAVPPEAESRLQARLGDFRARLRAGEPGIALNAGALTHPAWRWLGAAVLA